MSSSTLLVIDEAYDSAEVRALADMLFSDTLHRRVKTSGLPPNTILFGRALRLHAPAIAEPEPLLPGESSDRKQYEAPRFKRGKGRRQKDYQL